eukprot:TRINITY_DN5983_c0_g2_i1.p1 TRINITY_DN5983_c0_g2~~TRINITY_DN5983_c0_g2_i1.p1  ORF type:complete len:320 (-),score=83.72 TRINITY_DN5983_c0_g2_i1:525-1484(-)
MMPLLPTNMSSDDDEPTSSVVVVEEDVPKKKESRGQMTQRHKMEMKDMQARTKIMAQQAKKGDKKTRDDTMANIAKMEAELDRRHTEELGQVDAAQAEQLAGQMGSMHVEKSKGPSKKQQLKNKKAQQADAKRKQIDEEKKNIVPLSVIENNAILAQLKDMNMTIRDIPADGNCLFCAVADQLETVKGGPMIKDRHMKLRQSAAEYIYSHGDDFSPFLLADSEDFDADPAALVESYCAKISDPSVWGGQIEIQALTHSLRTPIIVHAANVPDVVMGTEYTSSSPPLHISYHKHAYTLGEHYNSVVPAPPATTEEDGEQK